MSAIDATKLHGKSKNQLIEMVKALAQENAVLKEIQSHMEITSKRLEKLEREQNRSLQYMRRDTVEISGIPDNIAQKDLEREVVNIYSEAGVVVHGNKVQASDIQACHRIGKKGITVCKFVNRKFAREGLVCGRNLKDKIIYEGSKVYINSSFCYEYKHLNYLIRKSKTNGVIFRWKVRNGTNFIQVAEEEDFIEITHKNDLIDLDLLETE